MPVGSVGKWFVLGTLVAALGATGCKEDDGDDGPTDSGTGTPDTGMGTPTDSGTPTDAGRDSSTPTDAGRDTGPVVTCGGNMCMEYSPSPGIVPAFPPGCARNYQDAEVCGLSSVGAGAAPDSGAPAFLQKDAPGVPSTSCAMYLETRVEPPSDGGTADAGANNGLVDTTRTLSVLGMSAQVALIYPGCCTAGGFCSIDTAKGTSISTFGTNPSNGGFGCIDPRVSFAAVPAVTQVPCDPTSGMIMAPTDGGTDGGSDGGSDGGASDAGADGGNG